MGLMDHGVARYQTLQQCYDLASLLAKGYPAPRRTVVGLSELMINALEHGNLGISYQDKSGLIASGGWRTEVERRQALPENLDKWVNIVFNRSRAVLQLRIEDQGQGFPWQEFLQPDHGRLFDSHGRGILLAKWETFDRIDYQGNGSCVQAELDLPA